jgi:LuxR family maltose regulon positive regulatory protein
VVREVDLVHRCWIAFVAARALRSTGGLRSAAEEVQRLRAVVAEWPSPPDWAVVVLHVALAEQALAEHLPSGSRPAAAAEVLARLPVALPDGPVEATFAVTLAVTRLRCGDFAGARDVASRWTGPETAVTERVTALVVDAIATDALGEREAALARFDLALHLAGHGRRLVGPLVAPGPAVHTLLTALLDRGTSHDDVATDALRLLAAEPGAAANHRDTLYVEPLSPREMDVLRLAQGTAPNAEIAGRLFISLNTLRSHLKAINRKLGTNDRRAAVRRARELGLI